MNHHDISLGCALEAPAGRSTGCFLELPAVRSCTYRIDHVYRIDHAPIDARGPCTVSGRACIFALRYKAIVDSLCVVTVINSGSQVAEHRRRDAIRPLTISEIKCTPWLCRNRDSGRAPSSPAISGMMGPWEHALAVPQCPKAAAGCQPASERALAVPADPQTHTHTRAARRRHTGRAYYL